MHFTVLTISNDYEEALAPYQENNCGDCPVEYLQWYSEELDEYYEYDEEEQLWKDLATARGVKKISKQERQEIVDNGEVYSTNPNAEWDWYEVGGRWSDCLLKKDGTKCDQCELQDLDLLTAEKQAYREARELYYRAKTLVGDEPFNWKRQGEVDGGSYDYNAFKSQPQVKKLMEDQTFDHMYISTIDKLLDGEEAFIKEIVNNHQFAYVCDDEGWYSVEEYIALHDATSLSQALENQDLDPDTMVTLVDCHM